MRKISVLLFVAIISGFYLYAQTNTFPITGSAAENTLSFGNTSITIIKGQLDFTT